MSLLTELKITSKQLPVLQAIAKSHDYFPELALDDLKFNNKLYDANNSSIKDLVDRGLITKTGKSLGLTRKLAKEYWNDIISNIPVEMEQEITKELLETKSLEVLHKAWKTLVGDVPSLQLPNGHSKVLTKEELINEILTNLKVNTMTDNKKDVKKPAKEVAKKAAPAKKEIKGLSPKEAAAKNGINPSEFRKMLRKLYGKAEGNWDLTEEMIKKTVEAHKAYKAEVSERRSENMAKLQAARKAKAEAKASTKAPAKKAAAKK